MRDFTSRRTLSFLADLRALATIEGVTQRELINKLDALEILILEDQEYRHDRLVKRRSEPSLRKRINSKVMPRHTVNYSLPRAPQIEDLAMETVEEDLASERFNDEPQDECSEDGNDSFARLSILLEQSIMEGQNALGFGSTTTLDSALEHLGEAPEIGRDAIDPSSAVPAEEDCQHSTSAPLPTTERLSRSPKRKTSFQSEITLQVDSPATPTTCPPSYERCVEDSRTSPTSISLIDDGVSALESLIDQLTTTTFSRREETGLTSSNLMLVVSFLVLVISVLVSRHSAALGVSCHCVCPIVA